MVRWFKFVLRLLLGMLSCVGLYLMVAFVLSHFTIHPEQTPNDKNIEIWLRSNGVHVDVVVPTIAEEKDWRTLVSTADTRSGYAEYPWLAFGWGDRGFYLNTPEWKDLRFSTAFNAAFGLGQSAMHTTFYTRLEPNEKNHQFFITKQQYAALCSFIESGFALDSEGMATTIGAHARYGQTDAFYAGSGRYSMFKTCNTWTNQALKAAELPHAMWTPFEFSLMRIGRKYGVTSVE